MKNIGKCIRKSRKTKKFTQLELANELKISRTTLSSYENNRRIPSIYILWNIADVLDISMDELIGRK